MKKQLSALLLSGALALSLISCAVEEDVPEPSPPVETARASQPVESSPLPGVLTLPPEPSALPSAELDAPDRDCQPWQTAYMSFLTALLRGEQDPRGGEAAFGGLAVDDRGVYADTGMGKEPLADIMSMGSDIYSLYDVDRDGVPELFVSYGYSWYITQCYTFRDGQVVCIGEFYTKDSGLYTHPEESAVLRMGGRMGHYALYEYPMEDGRLTEEREIFREDYVDYSTEAGEIIPGAEPIDYFYVCRGEWDWNKYRAPESEGLDDGRPHPSAGKALLLPICGYDDGPAATGNSSERARAAILAALKGETAFYGASGDHCYGDVGWTTWEEYIRPNGVRPYNDQPFQTARHTWLDLNGDGQEECDLQLLEPAEEDTFYTYYRTVVLSEQDGTVYAYYFDFSEEMEVYDDGVFTNFWRVYDWAVSFWRDQCYAYSARRGPSANPVEWLDGSPAG